MRTFFGLTSDYIEQVYEQFFFMKYSGNWLLSELYSLPIGLRNWFVKRTLEQKQKELKSNQLNEMYAGEFSSQLKYLLRYLAAPDLYSHLNPNVVVRGKKSDVEEFYKVISQEKKYMDAYIKYGLGSSYVRNSKYSLEKAIYGFEKETGLKWPIK
jgi:hypothetical protein